jgi:hypothetical protein
LNVGIGAQNFEALVLEDVQFSKLNQNPNYAHRKPAVEVEASRVPDDVAGTLVRTDCPTNAIVSQSQEAENQRRLREVDAKMAKLFAAKGKAKNGNGAPATAETSSAALVPSLIIMPAGEPSQSWWRQLTTGSSEREIERACAEKVCQLIVQDVLGRQRAQQTPISFDASTPILLRDLHQALDDICGPDGWVALHKRGEA